MKSLLGLLATSALLSGCVTPPELNPPPQPTTASHYMANRSFAVSAVPWPTDNWWTAYGDPQLDALIAEGLSGVPTTRQAEARLRRANAVAEAARAPILPAVNANGSITLTNPSTADGIPVLPERRGYHDYGRATLDFSWELDFWGRNRAALAAARSDERAAAVDAAGARLLVATSLAAAYADLVRLYADRDVFADTLEIRERTLALVRVRVEHGYDSDADLAQAEAGPPSARTDLAATDETIGITRNRIAALLGDGPDRGLAIKRPAVLRLTSFGLPSSLPAELLGRRPDIVAARWRVEAGSHRVESARAQFYPSVNLLAFIGFDALGVSNLLIPGTDVGGGGPALSLPIFDGGRRQANYRGARADLDNAVATYDDVVAQALREVADVVVSARQLSLQRSQAEEALDATERAYRLAQFRYRMGAADYQSVLLVEDRLLARRRILAAFKSRAFVLDVALVRALGGGVRPAPLG